MRQKSVAETGKKRGPKAGPPTVAVTVRLEPDLADWGKTQPDGLSALIRELLRKKRREAERREAKKRLADEPIPSEEALPL